MECSAGDALTRWRGGGGSSHDGRPIKCFDGAVPFAHARHAFWTLFARFQADVMSRGRICIDSLQRFMVDPTSSLSIYIKKKKKKHA